MVAAARRRWSRRSRGDGRSASPSRAQFTTPQTPAPRPPPLQRHLHGHDHQRRRRLQPLARTGGDALARGSRRAITGAPSATSATPRSGPLWSTATSRRRGSPTVLPVTFSADKAEFRRRDGEIETQTEIGRLAGGRCRGAPDHAHQSRRDRARAGGDQLRRDRARRAGGRRGAPGLQQPLRRDRVRRRSVDALLVTRRPRSAEAARLWVVARAAPVEPGAARGRSSMRRIARASSGGAHAGRAGGARRRWPLSNTVGAVLDPIVSLRLRLRIGAGRDGAPGLRASASPRRARRRSRWPTSTTTPRAIDARPRDGLDHDQVELRHLNSDRATRTLFQRLASRACSTPTRRCGQPPKCWRATPSSSPGSGPTASPATCRSSWRASTRAGGARPGARAAAGPRLLAA